MLLPVRIFLDIAARGCLSAGPVHVHCTALFYRTPDGPQNLSGAVPLPAIEPRLHDRQPSILCTTPSFSGPLPKLRNSVSHLK